MRQCIAFSVMFHFGELLEVSSTEFQIIESPLSVSTANMSDLLLEGKELSVSSPFGINAKVEKRKDDLIPTANGKWVLTVSTMLHFKGLTEFTYHWAKTYPC